MIRCVVHDEDDAPTIRHRPDRVDLAADVVLEEVRVHGAVVVTIFEDAADDDLERSGDETLFRDAADHYPSLPLPSRSLWT